MMPVFEPVDEESILELKKSGGLSSKTIQKRSRVRIQFENFLSSKGIASLSDALQDKEILELNLCTFFNGMRVNSKNGLCSKGKYML